MASAVVIAGVRSGVGKTTIASGIMGALARRGRKVQPFKAGPDYIDPTYHGIACGVPSRNLDTWLLPHPVVTELFHRASGAADIAVVEGVMGVFDGHSSLDEDGSTAELAKLLDAPVILIADAGKVARSVAAEILGYQKFDPNLRIAGVILNGVGSERHLEFCQPQIEATTGLPVVGWLPRRDDLVQPERHLGLIPTVEGTVVNEWYDALNAQVELTIDIDAIARIAATAGSPGTGTRPGVPNGAAADPHGDCGGAGSGFLVLLPGLAGFAGCLGRRGNSLLAAGRSRAAGECWRCLSGRRVPGAVRRRAVG